MIKRPEYLADEVPKMAAELVRLRAALREVATILDEYEGNPALAVMLARTALAPRSERREGDDK